MLTLKDIIRILIADVEEAIDLAGDVLPTTNYDCDLVEARKLLAENQVYREALRQWGLDFELQMLASECSELIHAALESVRVCDVTSNLFEEIADVEIMCEQIRMAFGDKEVDDWKRIKLERLARRVKEGRSNGG
jgi:hypothetical protein